MKRMKFIVEITNTGYSAYAEDHPVFTTGSDMLELTDNAFEAASLYYEEDDIDHEREHRQLVRERGLKKEDLQFEIDFQQFFQFYRVLNARFLAERIGMNPTLLSQYVQGRKKPSPKQSKRILSGIHQIGRELSEISLIQR